jgi:hypothetical protein
MIFSITLLIFKFINEDGKGIDMAVLINKSGNIVATHSIKISGHYDPERWDRDKVREFIEEKMQLLRDKGEDRDCLIHRRERGERRGKVIRRF